LCKNIENGLKKNIRYLIKDIKKVESEPRAKTFGGLYQSLEIKIGEQQHLQRLIKW